METGREKDKKKGIQLNSKKTKIETGRERQKLKGKLFYFSSDETYSDRD